MAEQAGWPGANPLLSGLFGALQSTVGQRLDTAATWSALRQAAGTWAWQAQGRGELPDAATLEANGAEILRNQGVGIQEVNTYRRIANEWRTAHENLHKLEGSEQLQAEHIFQPPWAQTSAGTLPSRYRFKVEWEIHPDAATTNYEWRSYEVSSPLTSLDDLLTQAQGLFGKARGSDNSMGAYGPFVEDYSLEQI